VVVTVEVATVEVATVEVVTAEVVIVVHPCLQSLCRNLKKSIGEKV
jgi:hypothetical protein